MISVRGFGFVKPSSGGEKDVFVHRSALEQAGIAVLEKNQAIQFEVVHSPQTGKSHAEKLRLL